MKLNVKAGQLAYITRSEFLENVGKIVEVVEFIGYDHVMDTDNCWRCHSRFGLRGNLIGKHANSDKADFKQEGNYKQFIIADKNLRPINDPDMKDEDEKYEENPTKKLEMVD